MKEEFYTRLRPLVKAVRDRWQATFELWPGDPEFSTHPWDDEEFELLHSYCGVKSLSKRQYWRSCLAGKLGELADATRKYESFVDNLISVAASHKFKSFLESEKKLEAYFNLSDLHPSGLQPGELILNAITGSNWEVVQIADLLPGDQLLFSTDEQCILQMSSGMYTRGRMSPHAMSSLRVIEGLCALEGKKLVYTTLGRAGESLKNWSFQLKNALAGQDDISHFFTVTYLSQEPLISQANCLTCQGGATSIGHFYTGPGQNRLIARLRKS
jgi:hypothetical protein